jgi:hypothetical protein
LYQFFFDRFFFFFVNKAEFFQQAALLLPQRKKRKKRAVAVEPDRPDEDPISVIGVQKFFGVFCLFVCSFLIVCLSVSLTPLSHSIRETLGFGCR